VPIRTLPVDPVSFDEIDLPGEPFDDGADVRLAHDRLVVAVVQHERPQPLVVVVSGREHHECTTRPRSRLV